MFSERLSLGDAVRELVPQFTDNRRKAGCLGGLASIDTSSTGGLGLLQNFTQAGFLTNGNSPLAFGERRRLGLRRKLHALTHHVPRLGIKLFELRFGLHFVSELGLHPSVPSVQVDLAFVLDDSLHERGAKIHLLLSPSIFGFGKDFTDGGFLFFNTVADARRPTAGEFVHVL